MDTSELYQKMCDCTEIQNFAGKLTETWVANKFKQIWLDKEGGYWLRGKIWLPHQDQIQEMMKFERHQVGYFASWVHEKDEEEFEQWQKFSTMEQLWLAFYMHEKHGKIWDGEKWVKE